MRRARRRLRSAMVRRRLENGLQRALSLLSAGNREEAVRRRARRLAVTLERIDEGDDGRGALCDAAINDARDTGIPNGGMCATCQQLEGTAA